MIAAFASLSKPTPPAASAAAEEPGFARTFEALAAALGVEERSLFNFRQRHKPRIKRAGRQLTRADGRHDIAAWRALAAELGELRGRVDAANPQPTGAGSAGAGEQYLDERALRLRERQLAVEKNEHKLAREKGEVLPLVDYQAALRTTIGGFEAALQQLTGRCADGLAKRCRHAVDLALRRVLTPGRFAKLEEKFTGLSIDTSAIVDLLESEIESVRATLAAAEFLAPES